MAPKNKQQKLSPENYIKQRSRSLPIDKCWVNEDWKEGGMAEVVITRKHSNGNLTYCLYMVDLLCLGVKGTTYFFNYSEDQFEEFWEILNSKMAIIEVPYTLAHNIIFSALDYAEDLGFKPHKDFTRITEYFLEEDTDAIELIDIECGKDGQPLYVQGPYDTPVRAREIINQLNQSKGPDGFSFVNPAGSEGEDDSDDFDEEFENDFDETAFEDKKDLFIQLIEQDSQNISEDRLVQLNTLTNELCDVIVSEEALDVFNEQWAGEMEMKVAEQSYIPSMLGLDDSVIITDEDERLLDSIILNKEDGWEALQTLRNQWGDFAFANFLNLQYLTEEGSDDFKEQLSKAVTRYPRNAIIRMEQYAQQLLSESDSCDEITFEDIFKGRGEITRYEMFRFQLLKLTNFSHHEDLPALEAMYYQLEDMMDVESAYFKMIYSTLIIARMRLLHEGLLSDLF